jgi:hypothetical protein
MLLEQRAEAVACWDSAPLGEHLRDFSRPIPGRPDPAGAHPRARDVGVNEGGHAAVSEVPSVSVLSLLWERVEEGRGSTEQIGTYQARPSPALSPSGDRDH